MEVKIGGVFYGLDIQKAMEKSHIVVMDAVKKAFANEDYDYIETAKTAIECYEYAFLERLKNE